MKKAQLDTIALLGRARVETVLPLYDNSDRELEGVRSLCHKTAALPKVSWHYAKRLCVHLDNVFASVPLLLQLFNVGPERTTGWYAHFLARNAVLQFWHYATPYLKATGGAVVIIGRTDMAALVHDMKGGEIVCPIIPQIDACAPPQTYLGVYAQNVWGWTLESIEPDFLRQPLFPEPLTIQE